MQNLEKILIQWKTLKLRILFIKNVTVKRKWNYEVGKDFVICILSKGIYRECVPNHIEQEGD